MTDFLIVAPTQAECQAALTELLSLLARLGFTVSAKKTVTPTQEIVFLGLQLSSNYDGNGGMRVTVPQDKLAKAQDIAAKLAAAEWVTHKQLQKAHGYFQHLTKAVFAAKAYMRRLRESLKHSRAPANNSATAVRVTRALQLDLRFWQTYAAKWNGQAEILAKPVDGTRVIILFVTVQLQLISAYPPKNEAKCNLAYSNPYVFLIYQLPSRARV